MVGWNLLSKFYAFTDDWHCIIGPLKSCRIRLQLVPKFLKLIEICVEHAFKISSFGLEGYDSELNCIGIPLQFAVHYYAFVGWQWISKWRLFLFDNIFSSVSICFSFIEWNSIYVCDNSYQASVLCMFSLLLPIFILFVCYLPNFIILLEHRWKLIFQANSFIQESNFVSLDIFSNESTLFMHKMWLPEWAH